MKTALLFSLFVAAALACPSSPLDGSKLYESPALEIGLQSGSPLIRLSVLLPDTADHNRTLVSIIYDTVGSVPPDTTMWNASVLNLLNCLQNFTAVPTYSQLVGHCGEADNSNATYTIYDFRMAVSWREAIYFVGDNSTITERTMVSRLQFRLVLRKTISLVSSIVLLDDNLFWAMLTRSEFDTASRAIILGIETRVANNTNASLIAPMIIFPHIPNNFISVNCSDVPSPPQTVVGKRRQSWICTAKIAPDVCTLNASDVFIATFQIGYSGGSGAVAPVPFNVPVDLSSSEDFCTYDNVDHISPSGTQRVYTSAAFDTPALRFWVGDTVFVRADFTATGGLAVTDAAIFSIEIAGMSLLNPDSYLLIYDGTTALLNFQNVSCPDAPGPSSQCFSFSLLPAYFRQYGDLLIAGTYDCTINGMRRSLHASARVDKARITSAVMVDAPVVATTNNSPLYGALGALLGVIALSAGVVVGVFIYRRRRAAPARNPRKYDNL